MTGMLVVAVVQQIQMDLFRQTKRRPRGCKCWLGRQNRWQKRILECNSIVDAVQQILAATIHV